jgi:hypothetical protein
MYRLRIEFDNEPPIKEREKPKDHVIKILTLVMENNRLAPHMTKVVLTKEDHY